MVRASLIAVAGAAFLVAWQDSTVRSAFHEVPPIACVAAVAQTAEERIDHLVTAVRLVEHGTRPASLPAAPSDARLAACPH